MAVLVALTAGCTTSDVLEPPAAVGTAEAALGERSLAAEFSPPSAQDPLSTAPVTSPAPVAPGSAVMLGDTAMPQGDGGPVAFAAGSTRILFSPVVGASAEEISPLTQRILQRAAERGIAVAGRNDPSANLVIKGYFSTLPEAGGTTLVYVWDVFDRAGTRVHRIQGKETALGPSGGANAMRLIADRTIDDLAKWLTARQG